jgi:hypothetical protein
VTARWPEAPPPIVPSSVLPPQPGRTRVKVLHVVTRFVAGAGSNTLLSVLGADRERYDVWVAGAPEGGLWERARKAGVTTVKLKQMREVVPPRDDLLVLFDLVRLIRRERFSVVHTHSSKAGVLGRLAAWLCRTPVIVHTIHGFSGHDFMTAPRRRTYHAIERLVRPISRLHPPPKGVEHMSYPGAVHRRRAMRILLATSVIILAVFLPATASARSGCSIDPMSCAPGRGSVGGAQPGNGQGTQLGTGKNNTVTPSNAGRRTTPPKIKTPRNGKRCTHVGRTTTCTYYRHAKAYKACVRRGKGHNRCRKIRRHRSRSAASLPSTSTQGFLGANIRQVGKIWINGRGHCSGTLVARGVIVTAAHCLYTNPEVQREAAQGGVNKAVGYLLGQGEELEFTPNSTYNGSVPIIETYGLDAQTVSATDGIWALVNSWVPQCFADNNMQCDIGFAELASSNGYYIGDTVGYWPIRTEMYIPLGVHYYDVGYPGAGVFSEQRNGYGNQQYYCDVASWQGERFSEPNVTSGVDNLATDNAAVTRGTTNGCQHTGGASGGPVFLMMGDGSWVINGVNSSAQGNGQWGWTMSWNYFGKTVTDLYCYIFGCSTTRALSAATAAAGHPRRPAPAAIRASG